jgi:hypothetical protein
VTAVVFLSQTEADLVSQGRLEEPGFRPHPRSRDYYHENLDEDDDLDDLWSEELSPQAEVTEPLEQIARAHHWPRYSYERALLVLLGRGEDGGAFLGVAVAAGGPRTRRRGTRRLFLGPWRLFPRSVSLDAVLGDLTAASARTFNRVLREGHSRPLPPGLSAALNEILRQRVAGYDELLRSLPRRPLPSLHGIDRPANLDANLTALRLFSRHWRRLEPVEASPPSDFAISIELATRGSENDYIADDAAEFLGWDRSLMSRQGWWEFRSGNMRLHLKNINVSNAENRTGADLVYVRREPDTVVLVQYKLLEILERGGDPIFRPDGRLPDQIARMLAFSPTSIERGADEDDARLGGDFAFVKFIPPTGKVGLDQRPEGRYFPADAVRRMLATPDFGPRGGRVHFVYRRRYIDGETFARLVRDRWIGSTGNVTELLLSILGIRPQDRDPLTLAVEERLTKGDRVGG